MHFEKEAVRRYWDAAPCGTADVAAVDAAHRDAELEGIRYEREPFIPRFARFDSARGERLLEVGVGAGTDHLRFARAGAVCTGIDLSNVSLETTRRRLASEGLLSDLRVADAETLPFGDASFDRVYSWGVIHHTPDTAQAAREILRVLRPGGRFCVMVYNRHSLVAAQAWLVYAALRGHPRRSLADVLAQHMESPGTKGYTAAEARSLFRGARESAVETVVTPYDMRIGRRRFLPRWSWRAVPQRLGWFHVVVGTK
ncbi:MAG TPA: class I SAM-dependent methyltransferase [Polyangiaceae bacterium]|nr:class I SAM-dependent methyltransferase [Polyangiaceae bacterium]